MILGITGYARSGKTTVATIVQDRCRAMGVECAIFPFAGPLKVACRRLCWDGEKDDRGRLLLQSIGQAVRDYEPKTWVNAWLEDAIGTGGWVIADDVRYLNEVHAIHALGGTIVRVTRPKTDPGVIREWLMRAAIVSSHPSERPWRLPRDAEIRNDGTIDDLVRKVAGWMCAESASRNGKEVQA